MGFSVCVSWPTRSLVRGPPANANRGVMDRHSPAQQERNLIYSCANGGQTLVTLVGQKKAVAISVKNSSGWRRWSELDQWMSGLKIATSASHFPAAQSVKKGLPDVREHLDHLVRVGRLWSQIIRQAARDCEKVVLRNPQDAGELADQVPRADATWFPYFTRRSYTVTTGSTNETLCIAI